MGIAEKVKELDRGIAGAYYDVEEARSEFDAAENDLEKALLDASDELRALIEGDIREASPRETVAMEITKLRGFSGVESFGLSSAQAFERACELMLRVVE